MLSPLSRSASRVQAPLGPAGEDDVGAPAAGAVAGVWKDETRIVPSEPEPSRLSGTQHFPTRIGLGQKSIQELALTLAGRRHATSVKDCCAGLGAIALQQGSIHLPVSKLSGGLRANAYNQLVPSA